MSYFKCIVYLVAAISLSTLLIACQHAPSNTAVATENNAPASAKDLKAQILDKVATLDRMSLADWSNIQSLPLEDASEGGLATFYSKNGQLRKIDTEYFAAMGKKEQSFYTDEAENLIYVVEKIYTYNRPMYYDSMMMVQQGDDEFFDEKKMDTVIVNYIFQTGNIIDLKHNKIAEPSDLQMQEESLRLEEEYKFILTKK